MVVCNSKEQAKMMYQIFLEKYTYKDEVVRTFEEGEEFVESVSPEEIASKNTMPQKGYFRAALILCDVDGKDTRKAWIDLFKNGLVDFLIVYQMLQTGFDAPRLKKLYLNRNVRAHNLLQTLTRVNRPYKDQKYGYVVDFADIEEEYEKTNGQYQHELEEQNGKKCVDTSDRLFVSENEAQEQIAQAIEAIEPYDMQSPEVFSRQINLEESTGLLNKLLKSLIVIQSMHNMLLTQGSDVDQIRNEFEEKCNFAEIKNFIKALKRRIATVNFRKHGAEADSVRQSLNLFLEDLTFKFESDGKKTVLELPDQYKQSLVYAGRQFENNIDDEDPEFKTLQQAFLDEVAKYGMTNLDDPESIKKLNMHDRVKVIDGILERIRRKNEEDNILALRYKGDKKFVRVEKRLKEKADNLEKTKGSKSSQYAFTKKQSLVNKILLNIKDDVDEICLDNDDIVTVEGAFEKKITAKVSKRFLDENLKPDLEARTYITALISKEYKNAIHV